MTNHTIYPLRTYIILSIALSAALFALYCGSLSYYWVWEDLHLVRTFSLREVISTFHGTWDVDKVETPGLRPITVLYNHLRCVLFDENLPAHKIFNILLFSAYLVVVCSVGNRFFGMKLPPLLMASLLMIAYKYNTIHILWQISSNRILQYLLLSLALILALRYCDTGRMRALLSALICYSASLFTREDTIAALPTLCIITLASLTRRINDAPSFRRYASFCGVTVFITILFVILRAMVISHADLLTPMFGLRGGFSKVLLAMLWAACPFGDLRVGSWNLSLCWWLLFSILLLMALLTCGSAFRRRILMIGLCYASACLPAYMILKPDVLFLPSCLFSIMLAMTLTEYGRRSLSNLCLSSGIYVGVIALALLTNYAQQQSFHPLSLEQIAREYDFLWGEYAHTTVPHCRLEHLSEKLGGMGITKDHFAYDQIAQKAPRAKLMKPKYDSEIFIPRFKSWKP